jgi:hypothetical protein
MTSDQKVRTADDLQRVVSTLAREFNTDTVFIVGSQAILMLWPEAPTQLRGSGEIDAYPSNAREWEKSQSKPEDDFTFEASEHIEARFGYGSDFHKANGFFIDGVDETTAKLPKGWDTRAVVCLFDVDGRKVKAIAPAPEDLIVSKLARLELRDKEFVEIYHRERPLDLNLIVQRIKDTDLEPEIAEQAVSFIKWLGR